MALDYISDRANALHRQLRTFVLPAPVQTEMRFELAELELKLAEIQRDERERLTSALGAADSNEVKERRSIEELMAVALSTAPLMPVVRMEDVDRFEKNNATGDKDLERRNKSVTKKLRELGEFRDLRKLPSDWQNRLARLERRFPNFDEPIEYLRASLYASGRRDRSIQFPPMLLDGPPGVFKSTFCEELADAFALPFARLDMASAQSSSMLTGSDIFWTNTRPGRVFSEVLLGKIASPVFLLDEMDKASGDERYPAINALYPLLETRTAKTFEDLSFPGIPFDASRVLWIGTSNDFHRLEAPIVDRMRVFPIKAPSKKAMFRLVEETVDQVLADLRLTRRDVHLGRSAVLELAELPPRAMKRTIMESVALSALRRRRRLEVSGGGNASRRSAIGFA